MKLKKDANVTTGDFWYDLFDGGYIVPEDLLESSDDIDIVNNAIEVLKDFRESLEEVMEEM